MKTATKKPKKKSPKTGKKISHTKRQNNSIAHGLRELFIDELRDIHGAEQALRIAMPKFIKLCTNEEVIEALSEHYEVNEDQLGRLDEVFALLNIKSKAKKCEAMAGLLKEAEILVMHCETGAVRDAAIIAAVQKIEHYEIATYGTLCSFAKILGEDKAVELLEETLEEEKEIDEILTEIAEYTINLEAIDAD